MTKDPEPILLPGVVDLLPIGVWIARVPGGELVLANAAFRDIMGMPARADVVAGGYAAPYGIFDRGGQPYPEERMPFARAIAAGETVVVDDIVIHRRDGGRVNIRASARPVRDAGGAIAYVVIAFIDVTAEIAAAEAQRKAEESRRAAHQLEVLGTLAAGVAHDFNNLIAAIRLMTARLRTTEADAGRRRDLEAIEEVTDSAALLSHALLTFGRRGVEGMALVDLRDLVGRMAALAQRTFEKHLSVRFDPPPGSIMIEGNAGQLEQLVMNLLINARDAMPTGGELVVSLTASDAEVVLEVTDSGPGVPPELRQRIFEPYFTTKSGAGRAGSGLGLASVYGAVEAHRGRVEVRDAVPCGACFQVTLPARS